jgi:hypothetical protein
MSTFVPRLSLGRQLLLHAILTGVCLFSPRRSAAEIILDDFDQSVLSTSPPSDEWAVTQDVGQLHATRQVQIAALAGLPDGQIDSNITRASALSASISHLNPQYSGDRPIVSVEFEYSFDTVDITEGGINDALFLDFLRLESEAPPSLLLVLVNDYAHLDNTVPTNSVPFTVVVPFVEFTRRGGGGDLPNFTGARGIEFEIRASNLTGGGPDPLNFLMQLDRIRVGRIIPEPSSVWLGMVGVMVLAYGRSPCTSNEMKGLR